MGGGLVFIYYPAAPLALGRARAKKFHSFCLGRYLPAWPAAKTNRWEGRLSYVSPKPSY